MCEYQPTTYNVCQPSSSDTPSTEFELLKKTNLIELPKKRTPRRLELKKSKLLSTQSSNMYSASIQPSSSDTPSTEFELLKKTNLIELPKKRTPRRLKLKKSKLLSTQSSNMYSASNLLYFVFFLVSLIISFVLLSNRDVVCDEFLDTNLVIQKLRMKLYGQVQAIDNLEKALKSDQKLKIIILTGGTGQGKSYTSQIIVNALNSGSVTCLLHQSLYSLNTNYTVGKRIRQCQYSLIVIDDLTKDDIFDISNFLLTILANNIDKINMLDIVLIFNIEKISSDLDHIQIDNSVKDIIHSHLKSIAPVYMIQFKEIERQYIRMCAKDALEKNYILPSEDKIDKLLAMMPLKHEGCKGIISKVALLHEG